MLQTQTKQLLSIVNNDNSTPEEVNKEYFAFLEQFESSTPSEKEISSEELIESLVEGNSVYLNTLARAIGTLFERGFEPRQKPFALLIDYYEKLLLSSKTVSESVAKHLETIRNDENFDDCEFDEYEEFENYFVSIQDTLRNETNDWLKLEETYLCGIALFSKSVEARKQALKLRPLARQSGEFNEGAHWLDLMLSVLNNEPFIAIERDRNLGVIGKMSGVVNNFQLHILLQDIFPGGWFSSVNPKVVIENAKGYGEQSLEISAKGKWNMYDWTSARFDTSSLENHQARNCWIWGEGKPEDIPLFEGYRVIILGKSTYQRSWNAQRMFGNLPAELKIEQKLSKEEIRDWLKKFADFIVNEKQIRN